MSNSDTITVSAGGQGYEIDRDVIANPTFKFHRAMARMTAQDDDPMAAILAMSDIFDCLGIDADGLHQSDYEEFFTNLGEAIAQVTEMTLPESNGSVASLRSTAKKSNTSASKLA